MGWASRNRLKEDHVGQSRGFSFGPFAAASSLYRVSTACIRSAGPKSDGTVPSSGQIFFAASAMFSCASFFLCRFPFAAVLATGRSSSGDRAFTGRSPSDDRQAVVGRTVADGGVLAG